MASHGSPQALEEAWTEVQRRQPGIQAREAAAGLGVTEAELVASRCRSGVTRLSGEWGAIVTGLPALGPVIAVTRNARAVLEKRSVYEHVQVSDTAATVRDAGLELRFAFDRWQVGFAVDDGRRRSLEFFDASGTAVHKVVLDLGSDQAAFDALVACHASPDQSPQQALRIGNALRRTPADEVDAHALAEAWAGLGDDQDVVDLLARFAITRLQVIRRLDSRYVYRTLPDAACALLGRITAAAIPAAVRVPSHGAEQTYTGIVPRVRIAGRWLNARTFGVNLQLRVDRIGSAWVVRRPVVGGRLTALELFDAAGQEMARFEAGRTPGFSEPAEWRAALECLPTAQASRA